MKNFKHLTYTDRLVIEKLYNNGITCCEISRYLEVHNSTIYREVKRGLYDYDYGVNNRYSALIAQNDYDKKGANKGVKELKIGRNHKLAEYIENKIVKEKYSPEAVLALIKNETGVLPISKTTLYRYIDIGVFLHLTNDNLLIKPHKKKSVKKVKPIKSAPSGLSIERRPEHINKREEFGHWEMDTVIGKLENDNNVLLVLTERKTRYEIIKKIQNKNTQCVVSAFTKIINEYGNIFKSITCDNGSEFRDYNGIQYSKGIRRTNLYYCHPYCSSERGSNENQNKMIRRFYPKGSSFKKVRHSDIAVIQKYINTYPRKILNYNNSSSLFYRELEKIRA